MDPVILVAIGGGIGAVARHIVSQIVRDSVFPAATFAVNVLGSFALGILLFGDFEQWVVYLGGVGFCGAFTTFSTFSFRTVMLFDEGRWWHGTLFAIGSVACALLGFVLGWLVVL